MEQVSSGPEGGIPPFEGHTPSYSTVAASTANVNLAAAPAALDGVSLAAGNRILLKNQTDPTENGIYLFAGAGAPLTRVTDYDEDSEFLYGAKVFSREGATNADTTWKMTSDNVQVGTDPINYQKIGEVDGQGTAGRIPLWLGSQLLGDASVSQDGNGHWVINDIDWYLGNGTNVGVDGEWYRVRTGAGGFHHFAVDGVDVLQISDERVSAFGEIRIKNIGGTIAKLVFEGDDTNAFSTLRYDGNSKEDVELNRIPQIQVSPISGTMEVVGTVAINLTKDNTGIISGALEAGMYYEFTAASGASGNFSNVNGRLTAGTYPIGFAFDALVTASPTNYDGSTVVPIIPATAGNMILLTSDDTTAANRTVKLNTSQAIEGQKLTIQFDSGAGSSKAEIEDTNLLSSGGGPISFNVAAAANQVETVQVQFDGTNWCQISPLTVIS